MAYAKFIENKMINLITAGTWAIIDGIPDSKICECLGLIKPNKPAEHENKTGDSTSYPVWEQGTELVGKFSYEHLATQCENNKVEYNVNVKHPLYETLKKVVLPDENSQYVPYVED